LDHVARGEGNAGGGSPYVIGVTRLGSRMVYAATNNFRTAATMRLASGR
jgi:hypothetical protein